MNKEVIYIEPENDITDIIDRVKTSKPKIVALVPPKKSTVLLSVVNFKLLARASKSADKSLVLVTADPSLLKLASIAEIPVAKNLQSRPEIPIIIADNSSPKDTVDAAAADEPAKTIAPQKLSAATVIEDLDADEDDAKAETADEDDDKSAKKSAKKSKVRVPSLDRWRKWILLGSITIVLFIGFLVWALVFAPSVKIIVSIRTTGENFSRPITFVTDPKKERLDDGVFALESATVTKKTSANFTATGEVNKGDKASGTISASYTFTTFDTDPVKITSGTSFTNGSLTYTATKDTTITIDLLNCDAGSPPLSCRMTTKVDIIAEAGGERYNTSASSGWSSNNTAISLSNASVSGGTDKIVHIISQRDLDNARALLSPIGESSGRADLLKKFPASTLPLENSLQITPKDPVSSPKVGEEVPEGTTPVISAETVFSMYGVDLNKLDQYIKNQLTPTLPDRQTIYSTGVDFDSEKNKARIEGYAADGDQITAKLTSYSVQIGPAITESEILDRTAGKKIGEVKTLLSSEIGGKGSVEIEKSVFWVSSVPEDPNKVEIIITFEE